MLARALAVPSPERQRSRRDIVAALVLLVGALVLYKPWQSVPLPVPDFGEILPPLTAHSGVASGWVALLREYAGAGRFMPLMLLVLSVNWHLWGAATLGWQLLRFILMAAASVALFTLARRLGATVFGACLGAGLLLFSGAAVSMWTLPQMADPIGVLCVLGAAAIALRYATTNTPWRVGGLVVALLAMAVLTTETFVACVPFVVCLAAVTRADGAFGLPKLGRRELALAVAVAGSILCLTGVPLLLIRERARAGSYASHYGSGGIGISWIANVSAATFLPITRNPIFPANVALIAIIAMGLAYIIRDSSVRLGELGKLAVAAILPICVALIYLPWPVYPGYYAYKALPGIGIILALSASWVQRRGGQLANISLWLCAVCMGVYGMLVGLNALGVDRATRHVNAGAAHVLERFKNVGELEVAVSDVNSSGALALTLQRYARSLGIQTPHNARDVTCQSVEQRPHPGVVLFQLPGSCQSHALRPEPPNGIIRRAIRTYSLRGLRSRSDTISAMFWLLPSS